MAEKLTLIYCLYPDKKEARAAIRRLLKNKRIVCANVLPAVESHYVWQGRLRKSAEVAVYFKTTAKLSRKVCAEIEEMHSYEVPLVAEIPLQRVNAAYLAYAQDILLTT